MADEENDGGGSAGTPAPDLSGLLEKVSEIIDQKLEPVASIVNESKNKSQRRNEELASQLKAEREKRESLEGKLSELGLANGGSVDEGLQLLTAQFSKLREDYDEQQKALAEMQAANAQAQSALRRKELEDLVLGDVAPDAKEDGRFMMDGYLKNKGIDLDTTKDLGALANAIRDRFLPRLSVSNADTRTAQATGNQPGVHVDPSRVNWDEFRSYADVPKNLKSHIPPDVFKRMEKPSFGGTGGGAQGLGV